MNLHEYQGKRLFAKYGLPVSRGVAARTVDEALDALDTLGGECWVVKTQVHAGGRGKAGGVKVVRSGVEVKNFTENWLGKKLVTYQTDTIGQPVNIILVEPLVEIANEFYLGAVIDRSTQRIVFMASTEGGVEIEKVAHATPDKILKVSIDPITGAHPYQGRQLAFNLGLAGCQVSQFVDNLALYMAHVGGRINEVDRQFDVLSDTKIRFADMLSKAEDLDYAKAVTELTAEMLSLEAGQASFAKITQLSLFDYIR